MSASHLVDSGASYPAPVSFGAAWKDRVVERSVERTAASARDRRTPASVARRALRPATRIVQAAIELAHEGETTSFTVQEVVDRAEVALQTFYRHFSSKDDLILAVIEEEVTQAASLYQKRALRLDDPVAQRRIDSKGPFLTDRKTLFPYDHTRAPAASGHPHEGGMGGRRPVSSAISRDHRYRPG